MSPWLFLGWAVAVAVSVIVVAFAIAAVIVLVRHLAGKETPKSRRTVNSK
jgi:mannose/fructose/N-acetylgalactosamine-specific phosphotransferase system component IIC